MFISGKNDEITVDKIMGDMTYLSIDAKVREAKFAKDWLPYFTGKLFDNIKEYEEYKKRRND